MGFVYILYSEKLDRYYIGSTIDVNQRLEQHNSGRNKSTKAGAPWVIKFYQEFEDISEARSYVYALKKKKSRKYLEYLISSAG